MITNSSPAAAYGWRARIGFLMPAIANQNHPHEFYLMAPEGVSLTLVSLFSLDDPRGGEFLNRESLDRAVNRIPVGARALAAQDVHVMAVAGVPHMAVQGWE